MILTNEWLMILTNEWFMIMTNDSCSFLSMIMIIIDKL